MGRPLGDVPPNRHGSPRGAHCCCCAEMCPEPDSKTVPGGDGGRAVPWGQGPDCSCAGATEIPRSLLSGAESSGGHEFYEIPCGRSHADRPARSGCASLTGPGGGSRGGAAASPENGQDVWLAWRHPALPGAALSAGGHRRVEPAGPRPHGGLTCDEGRLRGRLLQEDHVLQEGAVRRPVALQGRRAQVGREVGAREEGQSLLQGWEGQPLGVLLACRPLGRHSR